MSSLLIDLGWEKGPSSETTMIFSSALFSPAFKQSHLCFTYLIPMSLGNEHDCDPGHVTMKELDALRKRKKSQYVGPRMRLLASP